MQYASEGNDYRGKRALMLLRVSSPEQERGFGWPAQEREIRKKLIEPLGLRLDEEKHILRDTYTGLEFRNRPVLDDILAMARRHEFDVLATDVLDRLGRKGLARELYRMQLKELGISILTTDPQEHADDDSLIGEMIRILKGYQAEEELQNIRRRTMNGKRVKAEGDAAKGVEPMIIGNGHRNYGYLFELDARGRRVGIMLNCEVILVDEDGTEWTEVKVVTFIFESAAKGMALRQIAKFLNEKDIPSPYLAKGVKNKNMSEKPLWQASALSRLIWQSVYWGEARYFKKRVLPRVSGKKNSPRERVPQDEQVVIPVPAIVTKELAQAAHENVTRNKQLAPRNNKHPQDYLLRAGLVKCGYCGSSMGANRHKYITQQGIEKPYSLYFCWKQSSLVGICRGCSILTSVVDEAAWQKAVEIIQDPSLVDERVQAYKSDDPTADRRKKITAKLKEIRTEQTALQEYLTTRIVQRKLDKKTEDHLTGQLQQLAQQEQDWQSELGRDEDMHQQWKTVQERLEQVHERCAVMREKLSDPDYTPSYEEKRELLEFFGITVTVWRKDHTPRFEIRSDPPAIVSLLSFGELLSQECPARGRR